MRLEGIILSKRSQRKQTQYDLIICGTEKRKNELIDTENRLVVARDTGWWGSEKGSGGETWVKRGEMGERHRFLVIQCYGDVQHDDYS